VNIIAAKNTLRLIALATTDVETKKLALSVLVESESTAKAEMSKTCFADDIVNLREAMIRNNTFTESVGLQLDLQPSEPD
jgi:hypothetical protein